MINRVDSRYIHIEMKFNRFCLEVISFFVILQSDGWQQLWYMCALLMPIVPIDKFLCKRKGKKPSGFVIV